MTTRRGFLRCAAITGGAVGLTGAGACSRLPRPRRRPRSGGRNPECCEGSAGGGGGAAWGTEIRKEFRELECQVHRLLQAPSASSAQAREVRRGFVALHERLAAHSYSRAVAAAWRAFYRLTARLHEHRNAEAWKHPLPVVAHNGHQHAARMWIEEFARRGRSLSLLHFDTHADMRPVRRPGEVVRAVAELSGNQREQARGRATLERLIIDHATPVTAGVLGDAAGDVTWATPAWAYAPDFIRRPVQWASVPTTPRGHRLFQMLHDESADPEGPLPVYATRAWDEVSGFPPAARRAMEHVRERRLSYVRTHPLRGDGRRRLQRALGDGAFVMDIDLDYFMSIDSESGFSRRGRGTRTRAAWDAELGRRLREGRRLLDQRLEAFERLLTRLRDAGRIPSLITLADSTYMPFFPTLAGQAYWEYLPREYAGYVHWRVRHLLSDVYREHGVGAGV